VKVRQARCDWEGGARRGLARQVELDLVRRGREAANENALRRGCDHGGITVRISGQSRDPIYGSRGEAMLAA